MTNFLLLVVIAMLLGLYRFIGWAISELDSRSIGRDRELLKEIQKLKEGK